MKSVIGIFVLGAVIGGIFLLNGYVRTADGQSLLTSPTPCKSWSRPPGPSNAKSSALSRPPARSKPSRSDISSEVVAKIVEMPSPKARSSRPDNSSCRLG